MTLRKLKISFNPDIRKSTEISLIGRLVNFQIGSSSVRLTNKASVKRFLDDVKDSINQLVKLYKFSHVSLRLSKDNIKLLAMFLSNLEAIKGEDSTIFLEKETLGEITEEVLSLFYKLSSKSLEMQISELYPHDQRKNLLIPVWRILIQNLKKGSPPQHRSITFSFAKSGVNIVKFQRNNDRILCETKMFQPDISWFWDNFIDLLDEIKFLGSFEKEKNALIMKERKKLKSLNNPVIVFLRRQKVPDFLSEDLHATYLRCRGSDNWSNLFNQYNRGGFVNYGRMNRRYGHYRYMTLGDLTEKFKAEEPHRFASSWNQELLTSLVLDTFPFLSLDIFELSGISMYCFHITLALFERKARSYLTNTVFKDTIETNNQVNPRLARFELLDYFNKHCQ